MIGHASSLFFVLNPKRVGKSSSKKLLFILKAWARLQVNYFKILQNFFKDKGRLFQKLI